MRTDHPPLGIEYSVLTVDGHQYEMIFDPARPEQIICSKSRWVFRISVFDAACKKIIESGGTVTNKSVPLGSTVVMEQLNAINF